MLRLGKRGEMSVEVVVTIILVLTVLLLLWFGVIGPSRKGTQDFGDTLVAVKAQKIDFGDLTFDEKKDLETNNFDVYLESRLKNVKKGMDEAKDLLAQEKYGLAVSKLESEKSKVDEVLAKIEQKHQDLGDEKYILQQSEFEDLGNEIAQLIGSIKSTSSFTTVKENSPTPSAWNEFIQANAGKLAASDARRELFFSLYKDQISKDNFEKFKQDQMSGIAKTLTKAEIEYSWGLILRDDRAQGNLDSAENLKRDAEAQFATVTKTYPGVKDFAPMAQYKLAKLKDGKPKQFSELKILWKEYGGDYLSTKEGNAGVNIAQEIVDNYVKQGYSEYDVSMELHAVIADADIGANGCAEACSYLGSSKPFSNYGSTEKIYCQNSGESVKLSCDNKEESVVFQVNMALYSQPSVPALDFPQTTCEWKEKIDGDQVDGALKSGPVWVEFLVTDVLTSTEVCVTKRPANPGLAYTQFGQVINSEDKIYPRQGCEGIVSAKYYKSGKDLFGGIKNNFVGYAGATVKLDICNSLTTT